MNVNAPAKAKKHTLAALLAVLVIGAVFAACAPVRTHTADEQSTAAAERQGQYRRISAREARELLDKNPGAILLDVRTAAEFRERRIPRAILLPQNEIQARAAKMLPDKNALILVYCRSGNRSKTAASTLISMGYTNVYDFGGINGWPFETEGK